MRFIALWFAMLTAAFVQAAAAQDIPTRVGRLAYTEGAVSVYQDPDLGWDKAYVNTPITSENSVWTDRGARAEVRAGGIALRLDSETQLDISRLEENDLDVFVPRGSVNVRVRYKDGNDRITFSTPDAQFVIDADGRYRIDVDEDRAQSRLVVFAGSAHMESASGRMPVDAGRMAVIAGGEFYVERASESRLDRWADARDRLWQDNRARSYVSSDMTGYEELDRYGSWSQDPDYGVVWYPSRLSAGWAPYRYGHWSYVRPWGWTWIDDEPWGYAPSHYGRWVFVGNRWAWAPGYVRERPVWAPALVGFIGGTGFSFGVSSGAPVGWYPLAPWERYQPWYRASSTYVSNVNRHVVERAPRSWQGRGDEWRYRNRDRATTVVNRDVLVNRQPVQSSMVRVNPESIRQATVMSSPQAIQQVLPQRSDFVRHREENRTNVAAPTVTRQVPQPGSQPPVSAPAPQQQRVGEVVRPEFRRRGPPPVVAAPAPAGQPAVSAPAPQQAQPQNPAARVDRAQQRQAEEAARANAPQQAREQQRAQEAQRQQQEQAQRAAAEQQRQQQEQAQRAAREQQEQAQRAAREQQQQQQQAQDLQRRREEAAQRAADDTRRRNEAFQRQQQEQAQRAQQQQRQQQEAAQRAAQEQARAQQQQQQQQRQQQEAAQRAAQEQARAQQQQQQQQRQQLEAAQRAAQEQAQRAQQQANPAARGEGRGRGRDEDKDKDKDKEKDKDKDKR